MSDFKVDPPTPNLIIGLTSLASFVVTAIISQTLLKDYYLFDITSGSGYWFIWSGIFFSTAKRKPVVSAAIALGNIAALILGHFLGELDQMIRLYRDPSNMAYILSMRYDWSIWLRFWLLFIIMGAALQHKYTVDGYPAWMQRLEARMKRRIEKIWNVVSRIFPH